MGFPVRIQGTYGQQFATSTVKKLPLGSIMEMPGGEEFIYCRAGALALAVGKCMQQAVVTTGHTKDLAVAAAAAIGATQVTITNSTTAITADMYADGYMFVNDATGEGHTYKIKSNPAEATGSGSCIITLEEESKLQVALDTSSEVGLRKHPADGLLVAPTTVTGIVVGVTVCAVTATYYCWLLKVGTTAVLTNGTVIRGLGVCRSGTTPGAVDVYPLNSGDNNGQELMLGTVLSVGATTEYSLVHFNIL